MRKSIKIVALSLLISLFSFGHAMAAEVIGTGTLLAHGSGVASMNGSGKTVLEGSGELIFYDAEGDTSIEVTGVGKRFDLGGGLVAYLGFNGRAEIIGNTYNVRLAGGNVRLAAHGSGTVILKGHGHYRVQDNIVPFTPTGAAIILNP